MIDFNPTQRGFLLAEFKDRYGRECSIQESSLATVEAIWLGCDHETRDRFGRRLGARMHLTRDMAGEIAIVLARFAETGRVEPPNVDGM